MSYQCNACRTIRRIPAPPILDPEQQESSTALDKPSQSASQPNPNVEETTMDLDKEGDATAPQVRSTPSRRTRRKIKPRIPPLFERKAGHVVFRGNEMLPDEVQIGPLFASNAGSGPT